VKENSLEVVLDWLRRGSTRKTSVIFIQSHVPAHAELHLLFSMITPLGCWSEFPRIRSSGKYQGQRFGNVRFLDIPAAVGGHLIYKARCGPVGEDQVAHVELTRRSHGGSNGFYGEVFPEPKSLLTPAPKLPGTDGARCRSRTAHHSAD